MQPYHPHNGQCTQCGGGLELKTTIARFGSEPETRYFECMICGKLYFMQKPLSALEMQNN